MAASSVPTSISSIVVKRDDCSAVDLALGPARAFGERVKSALLAGIEALL